MTCHLTIFPPRGRESNPGQGIDIVSVSGMAVDCGTVTVSIHQTQPGDFTTPQRSTAVVNGEWSVDFTLANGDFPPGTFLCGDGNKYVISAFCASDTTCTTELSDSVIPCGDCPQVTIEVIPGDCVNGQRSVHFRAEVISAGNATYSWYFGVDEDNQPGEDNAAGGWLPLADANGVRVVEVDHIYETTAAGTQTVTVKLVTSSGPDSLCEFYRNFELEPCGCNLAVSLRLLDGQGREVSSEECLPPGNYRLEVASPTSGGIEFTWSVNGSVVSGQTSASFPFSLVAGEEKTISVIVEQGACQSSNAVTVLGCPDCSSYDVGVTVFDSANRDVTGADCLPPGNYTVRATSSGGGGDSFTWRVNDSIQSNVTGNTLPVVLGENDEKRIVLEGVRRGCRDIASVTLDTCPTSRDDGFNLCLMLKVLALLGLGLIFLGCVLLLCPAVATILPAQAVIVIGGGLIGVGLVLLVLGLGLWMWQCRPDSCDWAAFGWQALILLGLVMIYAGLCPACSWMLLGVIPLIMGAGALILWGRNCDVSRCRVLVEMISLFTFVVTLVALLEMLLASCVVTSFPIAAIIWGLMIAAIQGWLWFEANQRGCVNS